MNKSLTTLFIVLYFTGSAFAQKNTGTIRGIVLTNDHKPAASVTVHLSDVNKFYALWVLLITAAMGILYGIISGIIIQPAVFGIAFTTVLIVINFAVAILCLLFNMIFLAPFGKGSRMLVRYFSLSLGFCIVFFICYFLLMNTGLHVF